MLPLCFFSRSESGRFRVAASIPGGKRAVFLLEYEELLQRRLGRYEHVTGLRPLQLVRHLRVEVTIVDHLPITVLEVLPLRRRGGTKPARPPGLLCSQSEAPPPFQFIVGALNMLCFFFKLVF